MMEQHQPRGPPHSPISRHDTVKIGLNFDIAYFLDTLLVLGIISFILKCLGFGGLGYPGGAYGGGGGYGAGGVGGGGATGWGRRKRSLVEQKVVDDIADRVLKSI